MSTRERAFLITAAAVSLLLHGLIAYAVMNQPVGSAGSVAIFTIEQERELEPVRVFRAADDLIVDGTPAEADPLGTQSRTEEESIRAASEQLLNELNAREIVPPIENLPPPPSPAIAETPEARPAPPQPAAPVRPSPSRMLDATSRLLRMAEPSVALPEYVGPTDAVNAPPPTGQTIDPGARIDVAQLRALEDALGGGSGLAAGVLPTPDVVGLGSAMLPGTPGTPGTPGGTGTEAASAARGSAPNPASLARVPVILPDPPANLFSAMPGPEKETIHLDHDFDYTLRITHDRPRDPGFLGLFGGDGPDQNTPGWFETRITPKRSLHRLQALKKDVVWVLDTSGSISDQWITRMKRGVQMALVNLNEGDRFNIVTFKDTVNVLSSDGLIEANDLNRQRVERFLNTAHSGGYTDVNGALGRLIVRNVDPDRVYQIILISDGNPTRGAVDPRRIINMITRENDLVAGIYCVGVGDHVNKKLLEFLAYRNKGSVVYADNALGAAGMIRELAGRLQYPILKDATFNAAGVDATTIYPRIPRDIYQSDSFSLFGRFTDAADKLSMRLTGTNGPRTLDFTFTLDFDHAQPADEELARQWAFWKLHHLYSEMIRQGETDELQQQVDQLRKRYNLKTAY